MWLENKSFGEKFDDVTVEMFNDSLLSQINEKVKSLNFGKFYFIILTKQLTHLTQIFNLLTVALTLNV